MPNHNKGKQQTSIIQEHIVISPTIQEIDVPAPKIVRICWNTGEEKNCLSCYLSKGCKAKT